MTSMKLCVFFVVFFAVQLSSSRARVWFLTSDDQCYGRSKDAVTMLTCEEGLALKQAIEEMQSNITTLFAKIEELNEPEISVVMMSPSRGTSKNCLDSAAGPCGVGLDIDGVQGLVCFPESWSDDQEQNFARAVLPEIGASADATLVEVFSDEAQPGEWEYGWDYFNTETGIPGYWDLNNCTADSQDLQDYARCAIETTYADCSKTYSQRFFALFETQA